MATQWTTVKAGRKENIAESSSSLIVGKGKNWKNGSALTAAE